jgi:hypothetical protein
MQPVPRYEYQSFLPQYSASNWQGFGDYNQASTANIAYDMDGHDTQRNRAQRGSPMYVPRPRLPRLPYCLETTISLPPAFRQHMASDLLPPWTSPFYYGMTYLAELKLCFVHFLGVRYACPKGHLCESRHLPLQEDEVMFLLQIGQQDFLEKLIHHWLIRKRFHVHQAALTPSSVWWGEPFSGWEETDIPKARFLIPSDLKFTADIAQVFAEWKAMATEQHELDQAVSYACS